MSSLVNLSKTLSLSESGIPGPLSEIHRIMLSFSSLAPTLILLPLGPYLIALSIRLEIACESKFLLPSSWTS